MHYLPPPVVTDMVEWSGVAGLSTESSDHDVWEAIHKLVRLVYGLYVGDRALLYAAVVRTLEAKGIELGNHLEDLFFDRVTQEACIYGQAIPNEGGGVRATDRPLANRSSGAASVAPDGRGPAREQGGPQGVLVAIDEPGGTGEAQEAAEHMEGLEGGRGGSVPF